MAVYQRTNSIIAPWASSAQTSIPVPPVKGIGYRNTALTPSTIQAGQLYGSIGDSSAWNQFLWQTSSVAQMSEIYGIMPYSGQTQYRDRSLCLYTDRLIYRAKQDVPQNTPCTNTSYWEQYIPDGVQIAPPITAAAGLILYVDYTRSVSGDGLTSSTAFRNFSDCFTAIRSKFAAANGVFNTQFWLPLFTIIATGNTNNNIEQGNWRLQQMGIDIRFNKNFSLSAGSNIYLQGCVVQFSGAGTLTINGAFVVQNTDLTISIDTTVNNATSYDDYAGFTLRNGNVTVTTGTTFSTLGDGEGFRASGGFMNILGSMICKSRRTYAGGNIATIVSSDIFIAGTLEIDCANGNTKANTVASIQQSIIRNTSQFRCRYIELISACIINGGQVSTGSRYSRPDFGIVLRQSYFYNNGGSLGQLGSYDPIAKGACTVGGFVEAIGLGENQWPGGAVWNYFGNGHYYS